MKKCNKYQKRSPLKDFLRDRTSGGLNKQILLFIAAILVSGCSEFVEDPRKGQVVHKDFHGYVAEYEVTYNETVLNIPITYQELPGNKLGYCRRWNHIGMQYKEIYIAKHLRDGSYLSKKAIIFHELTHCVQDYFEHTDKALGDGCSGSIMTTSIPTPECLKEHWDYYEEELKHYNY